MNTTELLARIEALPVEWRHPDPLGGDASHVLDLHLRHIAERLLNDGIHLEVAGPNQYWCSFNNELYGPYALALISAAEEVCRG